MKKKKLRMREKLVLQNELRLSKRKKQDKITCWQTQWDVVRKAVTVPASHPLPASLGGDNTAGEGVEHGLRFI